MMPRVLQAEYDLIGSLMLLQNNAKLLKSCRALDPSEFRGPRHSEIFKAIIDLAREGHVIEILTVFERLQKTSGWTMAEAHDLAVILSSGGPTTMIPEYVRMISEESLRRRTTERAQITLARAENGSLEEMTEAAARTAEAAIPYESTELTQTIGSEMTTRPEEFIGNWDEVRPLIGVRTGVDKLDEFTMGWREGNLIVIAARPGVGKTGFAVHTALTAARAGIGVLFVSREMTIQEIHERLSAHISGIDSRTLQRGALHESIVGRAIESQGELAALPLYVTERPRTPLEIKEEASILGPKIGLIVIDYLGLLHSVGRFGTREQEVAWITRECKTMATELRKPVILLSQLSRAMKGSESRRPLLSDLKDSGAIESDANIVIFIYDVGALSGNAGEFEHVELILSKNRSGPLGTADVRYQRETGRFKSWP